jgi:hypothetical protein
MMTLNPYYTVPLMDEPELTDEGIELDVTNPCSMSRDPYYIEDEIDKIIELDVTPPPLSRLEFERETEKRALRGEPPPLCQICGILLSWFLDPPRIRTRRRSITLGQPSTLESDGGDSLRWETRPQVVHLGTYEEAVASPCSQHTAILKHLRLSQGTDSVSYSYRHNTDPGVMLAFSGRVEVVNISSDYPGSSSELLLADFPMGPCRTTIRVLDREWVDIPVISRWISECSESHGEECDNPMKIMRVVPDLLVDVKRKCIVEGRDSHRYMALSYRLGKAKPFRLRLRDLDQFGKHAILDDAQVLERLPLTVRHAILLSGQLGFDYLWTDVLCILHDGPTTLTDQLNKMSAIYASAATTIVAADGDGADGILGLHGISGPRVSQQTAFAIRDKQLIIRKLNGNHVHNADVDYNTRGWTYQEYIMSPRKLVFMGQEAHWICYCYETRESGDWARTKNQASTIEFIRSGYPDLRKVSELLSWYNHRNLTYPGDALHAITGLLAVLSRGFENGFLYGLPERFFDIGLGWRPFTHHSGDTVIEKACRLRGGPPLDRTSYSTTPAAPRMPSWSWTTWQGGFSFGFDEVAQPVRDLRGTRCVTSPITEWFTGSEPSSSNRRGITSDWHVDREIDEDPDKVLPEGWTRAKAEDAFARDPIEWWPLFWRSTAYRHQATTVEKPTFWYYPFRMPEINESTPFRITEQTRYLFCKTWKASVLLCDRRIRRGLWDDRLDMELWANDLGLREGKSRIGRMWLHNAEQFEEETEAATGDDERVALIDVVAISRSSFSGQIKGEDRDGEPFPLKNRINVLWVKWEQGIAYRVASGFVNEEDWKYLDVEEIDLVLG